MALESPSCLVQKTTAGIICNAGNNIYVSTRDVNVENENRPKLDIDLDEFNLPPLITIQGRENDIENLASLFFEKNIKKVVIYGLPGFGKTELAKHFARYCRILGKVHKVFWMNSDKEDGLKQSFKSLSKVLNISQLDSNFCVQYIYEHIKQKEYTCMFVFDNASKRKIEFEPPDNHFLLITSQEKDWGNDIKPYKIDPLSSESAVKVFETILGDYYKNEEHNLYEKLATVFENVPLGLQVSGAYVRQGIQSLGSKFELEKYITTIMHSPKNIIFNIIPDCIGNTYKKSLYEALKVSLNKIRIERDSLVREVAVNVLYTCVYLHPEELYYNEILLNMTNILELLPQYNSDEFYNTFAHALRLLDNFSLVEYNPDETKIKMHNFIQNILRLHLSEFLLQMQLKCYSACLQFIFETESNFFSGVQYSTILTYADDYVKIFINYFVNLKKNKKSLNNRDIFIKNILLKLVEHGCIKCLKAILNKNKSIGKKYITEFNLIHLSVFYDQLDILQLLLKYNINVNIKDHKNDTPLHVAAFKGNIKAIEILMKHNADLNARTDEGNTVLFEYFIGAFCRTHVRLEEVNEVSRLLKFKDNIDVRNDKGETMLHVAAASFQAELVELLITEYKMSVNTYDLQNKTPLHTLVSRAMKNDTNIVGISATAKVLIKHGASFDVNNKDGVTPLKIALDKELDYLLQLFYDAANLTDKLLLHKVIDHNQLDMLKLLSKYDFNVNSQDEEQNSLLHIAASERNVEAIQILIAHNADLVNARNCYGNTPLFQFYVPIYAQHRNCPKSIHGIDLKKANKILDLLTCGENNNITNKKGETVLHIAAATCRADLVKLLINKINIDVNKKDLHGRTALHILICQSKWANKNRLFETAQVLINNGAALNIKDAKEITPVELAINMNIGYLISLFLNTYSVQEYLMKINILHKVIRRNQIEVLNILLQYKIDINSRDTNHNTPLHIAAFEGHLEAVKILTKHNAVSHTRNKEGNTPLFEVFLGARYREYINLEEIKEILNLLNCKENKYLTKCLGNTLLHEAVASYHKELVTLLISEYGFNVNVKNKIGFTPLHTVIYNENTHNYNKENVILTVLTLKKYGAQLDIKNKFEMTPLRLAQLYKSFLIPYLRPLKKL